MKTFALLLLYCAHALCFRPSRYQWKMSGEPIDPLEFVQDKISAVATSSKPIAPPQMTDWTPLSKKNRNKVQFISKSSISVEEGADITSENFETEIKALLPSLPVSLYLEFRSLCEKLAIFAGSVCIGMYFVLIVPIVALLSSVNVVINPVVPFGLSPLAFAIPVIILWQWENGSDNSIIDELMSIFVSFKKEQAMSEEDDVLSTRETRLARAAFSQLFSTKEPEDLVADMRKLRPTLKGVRMPSIETKGESLATELPS